MSKSKPKIPINYSNKNLEIGIIVPYFNENIGLRLYEKTFEELIKNNVKKENIKLVRVPGALEIPLIALKLAKSKKFNAIIALGTIIKGETDHYDYVCTETYRGLMNVSLKFEIPIINGVLTVKNEKQAKDRINKGKSYAKSAIFMSTNF